MKALLVSSVLLNLFLAGLLVLTRSSNRAGSIGSASMNGAGSQNPEAASLLSARAKDHLEEQTAPSHSIKAVWRGRKEDLLKQLRDWGAPDDMILAVLFAHDRREIGEKRLALLYPDGVRRWSGPPRAPKEALAKLDELYVQRRDSLRQLIGPEFDLMLLREDPVKTLKWGNLPADQLIKIKQIDEQYNSTVLKGGGYGRSMRDDSLAWTAMIDTELAADIYDVLPRAQAEDFLTFNSRAAVALQKELSRAGINIDEETYRALYHKEAEFRVELAKGNTDSPYERSVKETQLFEGIMGEENALAYAVSKMNNFQSIDAMLAGEGHNARTRLDIYYEYMSTTVKLSSGQGEPAALKAQREADGSRFYQLLASKVSGPKFEQFRKSQDGTFLEAWRTGK